VASAYGQLAPAEKIDYTPANKELFSKFEKIDKAAKAVQEYETAVGKAKATQKYEDAVSNAGLTKQQEFVEKNFDDIVNDLKDKGILNTKCK
jgi:predicted transcriptional regulator YheO